MRLPCIYFSDIGILVPAEPLRIEEEA